MRTKYKKSEKKADFEEIYGIHAVIAALNNKQRNNQKLIISSNLSEKFASFKKIVKEIKIIPNNQFNKIYNDKIKHQGVILITSKLMQPTIENIINSSKKKNNNLILILDQVSDPQNIGSIMRSCALFNCYSIVVTKNNAPNITSSMIKAASGAFEVVNYIKVTNIVQTIKKFKQNKYWVVGLDSSANKFISHSQLPENCVLVVGAEGKGLRNLTIKECDMILKIPISIKKNLKIESLNVANASTIALYEHYKLINK